MTFSRNLAQWDRAGRFVIGLALVILAATGLIGVWGYVGAILVATAFMNFCPIYRIVGFKTCADC